MNLRIILVIIILLASSCSEKKNTSTLVEIGQTKEQIRKVLGEPFEIRNFNKTSTVIWGPEEEFWDKIPNGKMLEVWHYKDSNGQLNLYFVERNDYLSYKAYVPNNVVYESNQ